MYRLFLIFLYQSIFVIFTNTIVYYYQQVQILKKFINSIFESSTSHTHHILCFIYPTKKMSGCASIYFLDRKGKIIIYRDYRGEISYHVNDKFQKKVLDSEQHLITPVFRDGEHTFMWLKHNNIFIVAVSKGDPNVALIFSFLYKLVQTFTEYYSNFQEETLRDNFVTTYELLDQMMDHGYPQITEPKILQLYIKTEANKSKKQEIKAPPTGVTGAVSWRKDDIKHKKNQIFLDVIEKLDILVAANGNVLRSQILGSVKMRSFLSGMPELKLGLNDKLWFESAGRTTKSKTIEMDDIKFHQCVRLSRFESDRTISFIPPDGEFQLMSYRLNTIVKPLIWVESVIQTFTESKIEYLVRVKGQFSSKTTAHNVQILVPVPNDADSPVFKSPIGTVKYTPDKEGMTWAIKQFQGQKEFVMKAKFGFPSVQSEEREQYARKPIQVKFEIPYFTVSGIQVRYLKIVQKSNYSSSPWVRYIAMNGDYQLRMF